MEEHVCIHEQEFGKILAIMEGLVKEFYGNGNEGISKTIPKMQVQLGTLIETAVANKTAISALTKTMSEKIAIEIHEEKEKLSARQKTQIWISGILGCSGIIVTIILKFF